MWEVLKAITVELFYIPKYKDRHGKVNDDYYEQSYLWRLKIVSLVTSTVVSLAAFVATCYGFNPLAQAFVKVGAVEEVQKRIGQVSDQVNEIRVTALEQRLDKFYGALCMSRGDEALIELIRDLQTQYRAVRGTNYSPPSCDLLLKTK